MATQILDFQSRKLPRCGSLKLLYPATTNLVATLSLIKLNLDTVRVAIATIADPPFAPLHLSCLTTSNVIVSYSGFYFACNLVSNFASILPANMPASLLPTSPLVNSNLEIPRLAIATLLAIT